MKRFLAVLTVIMSLVISSAAMAKTGAKARQQVMQAGATGSVKLVNKIFSYDRPQTTPLLEWAKAATEKAKSERINRTGDQAQAPAMTEEEMMFSRDRD